MIQRCTTIGNFKAALYSYIYFFFKYKNEQDFTDVLYVLIRLNFYQKIFKNVADIAARYIHLCVYVLRGTQYIIYAFIQQKKTLLILQIYR